MAARAINSLLGPQYITYKCISFPGRLESPSPRSPSKCASASASQPSAPPRLQIFLGAAHEDAHASFGSLSLRQGDHRARFAPGRHCTLWSKRVSPPASTSSRLLAEGGGGRGGDGEAAGVEASPLGADPGPRNRADAAVGPPAGCGIGARKEAGRWHFHPFMGERQVGLPSPRWPLLGFVVPGIRC